MNNKVNYSEVLPNPKENKVWLSFKGVLSAYSTKKNKFVGLGSVTQPNKPEDTPELLREIKFYVSHTGPHSSGNGVVEYTAKEGMTWKEFCESEYNVNNFTAYESPDEEYYDYNSEISTYNYSEDDGTSWGGYEEYGWLAPTPANLLSNKILPNQIIIADATYYEQWASSGIGGGF